MNARESLVLGMLLTSAYFPLASPSVASPISDSQIYAVDSASQLIIVDVQTGRTELVGSTAAQFTDIAADPDGRLFGVTTTYLYEIDPENGWSTLIGRLGPGGANTFVGIDSLAFDHHGALFAAGDDLLITIDPLTGTGTMVGSLSGYRSAGDLTIDQQGRLLLTTDQGMLVEVHRDGSGADPIGSLPFVDIFGLGTLPTGDVIGIRGTNQLVTIDSALGRASSGSPLTADFLMGRTWGAAFPAHVPEPATIVLMTLGVILGAATFRSRKPSTLEPT